MKLIKEFTTRFHPSGILVQAVYYTGHIVTVMDAQHKTIANNICLQFNKYLSEQKDILLEVLNAGVNLSDELAILTDYNHPALEDWLTTLKKYEITVQSNKKRFANQFIVDDPEHGLVVVFFAEYEGFKPFYEIEVRLFQDNPAAKLDSNNRVFLYRIEEESSLHVELKTKLEYLIKSSSSPLGAAHTILSYYLTFLFSSSADEDIVAHIYKEVVRFLASIKKHNLVK